MQAGIPKTLNRLAQYLRISQINLALRNLITHHDRYLTQVRQPFRCV